MFRPPRPNARIAPNKRGRPPPLLPRSLRCPGTRRKCSRIPGNKVHRNNRLRPCGRLRLSRCRHSRRLPRGSRVRRNRLRRLRSTRHHNSRNMRPQRSSPRSNTLRRNHLSSSSTRPRNHPHSSRSMRHSMRPHRGSPSSSTRRRNHRRSSRHHRLPQPPPRHPGSFPSPPDPRLLYGSWSWDLQ